MRLVILNYSYMRMEFISLFKVKFASFNYLLLFACNEPCNDNSLYIGSYTFNSLQNKASKPWDTHTGSNSQNNHALFTAQLATEQY